MSGDGVGVSLLIRSWWRFLVGGKLGPYHPTPNRIVHRMIAFSKPRRGEKLLDIGCGDGRLVIQAAKEFGLLAKGIEIDKELALIARKSIENEGLSHLCEIVHGDAENCIDLRDIDIVCLYLSDKGNAMVREKIVEEWQKRDKRDLRVVSFTFPIQDLSPKLSEKVDGVEMFLFDKSSIKCRS